VGFHPLCAFTDAVKIPGKDCDHLLQQEFKIDFNREKKAKRTKQNIQFLSLSK